MSRNDDQFAAFASAQWAGLVRAGVVLGCELHEAQDLAQTTLLRCYSAWNTVQRAENPNAYVHRVLLNSLRDSRRRRWWREVPTESSAQQPRLPRSADIAVAITRSDALTRALADLSVVNREVVVLRHLAQLSERETADILGIATGTVKSRLSRALTQLSNNEHLVEFKKGPSS